MFSNVARNVTFKKKKKLIYSNTIKFLQTFSHPEKFFGIEKSLLRFDWNMI